MLGHQLLRSELTVRDNANCWLCQAPFEFGEHVATAKRLDVVTASEIEQIIVGSRAPGWSDRDRALIRAVEELWEAAMISDETWAILAQHLGEKQLIELPVLVGQYQGLAYFLNSLRIPLMGNNKGLSQR